MYGFILAALINLAPGYNNIGQSGEVVAVNAATAEAAATVSLQKVSTFTTYSNIVAEVVSYDTAFSVTYTNFDGNAAINTNVLGYVDWDAFKDTNGVQRIVGEPVRFDLATTNEVVTGQAIANVYVATNDLATVTTENHFGNTVTNGYLMGEAIIVTGAAEGDRINILTK